MGGVGPRSTGGPTRSRMRDLNFTGQITPWNQFVCGWRLEFKAKQLCDSWYYVELSAATTPLHFFGLNKDPDFGVYKDPNIWLSTVICFLKFMGRITPE